MSEKRDLYFIDGELHHGNPGGSDMRPFEATDLDTYGAVVTAAIAAADATTSAALYESVTATATSDGLTTGTITSTAKDVFVTVTSADANNIIVLPTPTPGRRVRLLNGATGYELRSSAPASVGINGGTSAAAESAIAASTYVVCECTTATNWVCHSRVANGTLSVVQVAAD